MVHTSCRARDAQRHSGMENEEICYLIMQILFRDIVCHYRYRMYYAMWLDLPGTTLKKQMLLVLIPSSNDIFQIFFIKCDHRFFYYFL